VDSGSKEDIEFGSKRFPFKTIESALHEIRYLQRHYEDLEVEILFKENSTTIFANKMHAFVNLKRLTFKSYSLTSSDPSKSTLSISSSPTPIISKTRLFSIAQSEDLKYEDLEIPI